MLQVRPLGIKIEVFFRIKRRGVRRSWWSEVTENVRFHHRNDCVEDSWFNGGASVRRRGADNFIQLD